MVVMAAFLAIQSLDISTYPLVGSDEATLNDPGLQLIKTGHFRSDVLSLNPGYEQPYLLYPPGLSFAAAASYLLFGFGLWQTRLPGIVFGALGVALIFYFVR